MKLLSVPEEALESLVADDGWFSGAFAEQFAALIKEDPIPLAPALVKDLVAEPHGEVLARHDWILTLKGLSRHKGNAAFVKNLKTLFAKTKRKRFALALSLVGYPKPQTEADGVTVVNVEDYR